MSQQTAVTTNAQPTLVAAKAVVQVSITSQPLTEALRSFAEQTGLEVAFRTEEISPSLMSRTVVGSYTPEAALSRLLGNSNLRAIRVTDRLIAVKPVARHTSSPAQSPRSVDKVAPPKQTPEK